MLKRINKTAIYCIMICFVLFLEACDKAPQSISSSSASPSARVDEFIPELRICGSEAFSIRSDDYIYDYEKSSLYKYTCIEEDENYLYFTITSGEKYYILGTNSWASCRDFVRVNIKTGEKEVIDSRVISKFTTIKNDKIYYYKWIDNNGVLFEYNTRIGKSSQSYLEGDPRVLYTCQVDLDGITQCMSQSIQDAGDGKYMYYDYINNCSHVVDIDTDKNYELPFDEYGFICDYDGKYYYGEHDIDSDQDNGVVQYKAFRLMRQKIESNSAEKVCEIETHGEDRIRYTYAGNGCVFLWDRCYFGKYWIFDIKTGKLIYKESEKQYDGFVGSITQSYWTLTYDSNAFYFIDCTYDSNWNYTYSLQKVNFNNFNQEEMKNIPINSPYSDIKVCNGYMYVFDTDCHSFDTIIRYDMDGSNPVEIMYNKYKSIYYKH